MALAQILWTGQCHKKKLGKTLGEHDRAVKVYSVLL